MYPINHLIQMTLDHGKIGFRKIVRGWLDYDKKNNIYINKNESVR